MACNFRLMPLPIVDKQRWSSGGTKPPPYDKID